MIDPDQIAEIAESLRRIVLSDSDNRWEQGQALVVKHNEDEEWKALCEYAERQITKHKGDQFTGEATVWRTVLRIIKSVP